MAKASKTPVPAPAPEPDDDDIRDPILDSGNAAPSAQSPQNPEPEQPRITVIPGSEVPSHDPFFVDLAKQYHLTDEQIGRLSPDDLRDRVKLLHQSHQERARHFLPRGGSPVSEGRDSGPRAAPPAAPVAEKDPLDEIDLSQWDESTQKAFAPLIAAAKKTKQLEAQLAEQSQREKQRTVLSAHDAIDDAIESLGEGYHPFLGKGSRGDVAGDDTAMGFRELVIHRAKIDWEKDSQRVIKSKIAAAASAQFGKLVKAPAPADPTGYRSVPDVQVPPGKVVPAKDPVTGRFTAPPATNGHMDDDEVTRWSNAQTVAPTQRGREAPEKGEAAARAVAREKLKELGLPVNSRMLSEEDREAFEGLPDD